MKDFKVLEAWLSEARLLRHPNDTNWTRNTTSTSLCGSVLWCFPWNKTQNQKHTQVLETCVLKLSGGILNCSTNCLTVPRRNKSSRCLLMRLDWKKALQFYIRILLNVAEVICPISPTTECTSFSLKSRHSVSQFLFLILYLLICSVTQTIGVNYVFFAWFFPQLVISAVVLDGWSKE